MTFASNRLLLLSAVASTTWTARSVLASDVRLDREFTPERVLGPLADVRHRDMERVHQRLQHRADVRAFHRAGVLLEHQVVKRRPHHRRVPESDIACRTDDRVTTGIR